MTPLEEICPDLPSRFAAKLADLRRGGARSIVDVPRTGLAPLYGEMLAEIDLAHAPRGKHAHTFARATFLREWLLRREITILFNGWATTTCPQLADSISALASMSDEQALLGFDDIVKGVIGGHATIERIQALLFDGQPILFAAEAETVARCLQRCDSLLSTHIATAISADCADLIRQGAFEKVDETAIALIKHLDQQVIDGILRLEPRASLLH